MRAFAPCARSSASAARSTREVTGRLTESLGGVRVVKGYHAEARERRGLLGRRGPAPAKRAEDPHRHLLLEPLVHRAPGRRGRGRHVRRRASDPGGHLTVGGFFTYTMFLGFLVAPDLPDRVDRHPAHGSPGRARAHARGAARAAGGRGSAPDAWRCRAVRGDVVFEDVTFAYEAGKPGARRRVLPGRAGHRHRARGPLRRGQVHDHRPHRRVPRAHRGPRPRGRRWTSRPCASTPTARSSASCSRRRSSSTARSARTWRSRGPEAGEAECCAACRIARVDEFAESFPRGLRHRRGRARGQALGRPEAARLHRARDPRRPAHPDPRRGHVEPGLGVGGPHPGRALPT